MPRPYSARWSAEKTTANPTRVPGAAPVIIYLRHGTDRGCRSIAAQQEKALSFLATHSITVQLDAAGEVRRHVPTRPAGRRENRNRQPQE